MFSQVQIPPCVEIFWMVLAFFRGWVSSPSATWATPLPTPRAFPVAWLHLFPCGCYEMGCLGLPRGFHLQPLWRVPFLTLKSGYIIFQFSPFPSLPPFLPYLLLSFLFISLKISSQGLMRKWRFQHEFSLHS